MSSLDLKTSFYALPDTPVVPRFQDHPVVQAKLFRVSDFGDFDRVEMEAALADIIPSKDNLVIYKVDNTAPVPITDMSLLMLAKVVLEKPRSETASIVPEGQLNAFNALLGDCQGANAAVNRSNEAAVHDYVYANTLEAISYKVIKEFVLYTCPFTQKLMALMGNRGLYTTDKQRCDNVQAKMDKAAAVKQWEKEREESRKARLASKKSAKDSKRKRSDSSTSVSSVSSSSSESSNDSDNESGQVSAGYPGDLFCDGPNDSELSEVDWDAGKSTPVLTTTANDLPSGNKTVSAPLVSTAATLASLAAFKRTSDSATVAKKKKAKKSKKSHKKRSKSSKPSKTKGKPKSKSSKARDKRDRSASSSSQSDSSSPDLSAARAKVFFIFPLIFPCTPLV